MNDYFDMQKKKDRDLEGKIAVLDKYATDSAGEKNNGSFLRALFPDEAQRERAKHKLRLLKSEFHYREEGIRLLRETQLQAMNEILKDYLVKWDTPRKRELAEFVTEQKMLMEQKIMDITDEFNDRITRAYEKAEKLMIPELRKRAMEKIFETIDSYHDMISRLQRKFQRIIEDAENRYGV